jgi:hypothetical protein
MTSMISEKAKEKISDKQNKGLLLKSLPNRMFWRKELQLSRVPVPERGQKQT